MSAKSIQYGLADYYTLISDGCKLQVPNSVMNGLYLKFIKNIITGEMKHTLKLSHEGSKKYADLVFLPQDKKSEPAIQMFELKYIKKGDESEKNIADALSAATEQLNGIWSADEFSDQKIVAFAIVFVGDKCVRRAKVHMEA
jgi:hypothetical protein